MSHVNESTLRELYERFAQGDIVGFLSGCTDDVTFVVPGDAAVSGTFTKETFAELLAPIAERAGGTFREDVLDVCANDEHGVLLLHHQLEREGLARTYRTAHIVSFADGRISSWTEHPGSLAEFESAWGAP